MYRAPGGFATITVPVLRIEPTQDALLFERVSFLGAAGRRCRSALGYGVYQRLGFVDVGRPVHWAAPAC